MVPPEAEVVVVAASDGNELDAAELLAAVGLRVRGFLGGGMSAWRAEERPVSGSSRSDPTELAELLAGEEPPLVLDVRGAGEYADGHIAGSLHIPYGELARRLDEVPRDRAVATICKGGKRSGLAASVLQREGFETIHVARGGVGTWQAPAAVETADAPASRSTCVLSTPGGGGR